MASLTQADMVWNRACGESPMRSLPGDRALADLLRAHGLAMNGGLLHAVECLTVRELSDAEAGYRFYGFDDVPSLLTQARAIFEKGDDLEFHEKQLDRQYSAIIPAESSIAARFEKLLSTMPTDFAPLRARDMD
jgi:hypothetical protein